MGRRDGKRGTGWWVQGQKQAKGRGGGEEEIVNGRMSFVVKRVTRRFCDCTMLRPLPGHPTTSLQRCVNAQMCVRV